MTNNERVTIQDFRKCDFTKIHQYLQNQAERKRTLNRNKSAQKKKETKRYGLCTVDGRKQSIVNYKIEPPSLFRGRGNNRLMGKIKPRTMPKDVIINIGRGVKIPQPSVRGSWKEVVHDRQVMWLASWTDVVTNKLKYIYTSSSSDLKVENDIEKYEVARDLSNYIRDIRKKYARDCRSQSDFIKQRGLALYFIDKIALRIGNESFRNSSNTFGCCSLQKRHIRLSRNGRCYFMHLHFAGKDSIAFRKKIAVPKNIFIALKECIKDKGLSNKIFDLIQPSAINDHLRGIMPDLTAKTFRTYNSSKLFEQKLYEETEESMTLSEKLLCLDKAYVAVADLCNHKKSVPRTHQRIMRKLMLKIKNIERQIQNIEDIKKNLSGDEILRKKAKKEKLENQLVKARTQHCRKELTKDYNLTTAKLNYIDPRITVAWTKEFSVPTEKIFSKSIQQRFSWAEEAEWDYEF